MTRRSLRLSGSTAITLVACLLFVGCSSPKVMVQSYADESRTLTRLERIYIHEPEDMSDRFRFALDELRSGMSQRGFTTVDAIAKAEVVLEMSFDANRMQSTEVRRLTESGKLGSPVLSNVKNMSIVRINLYSPQGWTPRESRWKRLFAGESVPLLPELWTATLESSAGSLNYSERMGQYIDLLLDTYGTTDSTVHTIRPGPPKTKGR